MSNIWGTGMVDWGGKWALGSGNGIWRLHPSVTANI